MIISEIQAFPATDHNHMTSIATADVRACAIPSCSRTHDIERATSRICGAVGASATSCVHPISTLYTLCLPTATPRGTTSVHRRALSDPSPASPGRGRGASTTA